MNIKKREGYFEKFDSFKVSQAVMKALEETNEVEVPETVAKLITDTITEEVEKSPITIHVETIQDWIEDELIARGLTQTAKAFIKYRQKRTEIRNAGWQMDDLQRAIWEKKYKNGNETFDQWIQRVSGGNPKVAKLIKQKKFIFAGRILAHRGLHDKKVTYSNCYVIPQPEDNLESIFDTAKQMARTYSYGGGCGVDISKIRPRGAKVNNSAKETTGAVSFMQLFDMTTGLIGQNGRRGALMISIADTHPDLEEFIDIKAQEGSITKANISIRVSNDFMTAVEQGHDWRLHWTGEDGQEIVKIVNAREIFKRNAKNNWDWAEAGILFWDRITSWHLMSEHPDHEYAGVNPCAEAPLMAGGSCLLGSLNLSEFVVHPFTEKAYFDFNKFIDAVMIAVEGLNEVLDEGIPLHPLKVQRDNARDWRQIGLGIMGLADMFIKLGISYGSEESLELSRRIGKVLKNTALIKSSLLALEKGVFPKYNKEALFNSEYFKSDLLPTTKKMINSFGLRNSQILAIAPTGSISTMWGVSGGIEPIFATHFERKTESLHGEDVVYKVNIPIVKEYLEATGQEEIPKELFKTAHDLNWKDRIKMQGVWQNFIDASISSTVNLPNETTVEEVEELFIEAWKEGLKGVTIFRDGCKRAGILTLASDDPKIEQKEFIEVTTLGDTDKMVICPECGEKIEVITGGCTICMNCGHSPCN